MQKYFACFHRSYAHRIQYLSYSYVLEIVCASWRFHPAFLCDNPKRAFKWTRYHRAALRENARAAQMTNNARAIDMHNALSIDRSIHICNI